MTADIPPCTSFLNNTNTKATLKAKIPIIIRPARLNDLKHLGTIEFAADQVFRETRMYAIAALPPNAPSAYVERQGRGHIWVAVPVSEGEGNGGDGKEEDEDEDENEDDKARPVGFISIDTLKTTRTPKNNKESRRSIFIHQVSVDPSFARQGIGRKLFEHVADWARRQSQGARERERYWAVDLTTFSGVPWNKVYYERLGYAVLSDEELQREDASGLKARKEAEERDEVLCVWKEERVCMRKLL